MKVFPYLALVLGASLACQSIETRRQHVPEAQVFHGVPTARFAAVTDALEVGHVVRFEQPGRANEALFIIRNKWGQDLGLVDRFGRAFRYVPHSEEPECMGTGTVAVGAARILGRDVCELIAHTITGSRDDIAHRMEEHEKE